MENFIKVTRKDKITSIRVSERVKKELESVGVAGDSHEEIIKRLINLAKNKTSNSQTKIIKKGNITGTKYGRISRTFNIETEADNYSVVCTFNDLSLMNLISENKSLQEHFAKEWELDLEIVNLSKDGKDYKYNQKIITWEDPKSLYKNKRQDYNLLYLVAVKSALEETFGIKIFEITTYDDYFSTEKWRTAYLRNKLSMDSFYSDIQEKLKENASQ